MTTPQLPQHPKVLRVRSYASAAPPGIVEYTYYAIIFYGMLAPGLGILVPILAGGMLLVLAVFCVIRLGSRATAVYAPIRLPLACVMSYLVVQSTVYGASIMGDDGRGFITWMLSLIITQSLCLRRRFLHRCTLVLFIMGLTTLPYLVFWGSGGVMHERAAVDRSMISGDFINANGLGAWFGFCCLYFIIVTIETKRNGVRLVSSLMAVGCLYIVGLTVSRGTLLAIAIGITIAFRRLLRRGFVPLLVFLILSGIIVNLGVFDQTIARYTTRSTEETGRSLVWPLAIERFLSSPLLGVGAANVRTHLPGRHKATITPHNGFLYFALSSGVLPFALFVAWWIRAAQNVFSYGEQLDDGPFRSPLLAYTFVNMMFSDLAFMVPWSTLMISVAMAPNTPYGVRCLVVHRKASDGQHFGHHAEARPLIAHRQL
jgi:O-antigen ligase